MQDGARQSNASSSLTLLQQMPLGSALCREQHREGVSGRQAGTAHVLADGYVRPPTGDCTSQPGKPMSAEAHSSSVAV